MKEKLLGISHLKLFPDPLQPSGWSSGAIPSLVSILKKREVVWHNKIIHLKLFAVPLQPSGLSSGAIPIPMRDSMEFCLIDMA